MSFLKGMLVDSETYIYKKITHSLCRGSTAHTFSNLSAPVKIIYPFCYTKLPRFLSVGFSVGLHLVTI